ncbi:MAG: sugar phosphate isomerase/epimerase [Oscillospiraceae bacterium]
MKVSVSTYSFQKMLDSGEITQFGIIEKAKELGFDGVEFVDILPHDGSSVEEYAKKLGEECKRVGMHISNYTIGADFLIGSDGDFNAEIERVKKQIDIAAILGATSVRHDATRGYDITKHSYKGFTEVLPIIADGCRQVTEYAKTKGIKTMVENHGFYAQDADRVESLINAVANDNFGWLCDMGNFLCVDEDPIISISKGAPYAFNVHAKDFHVKSGMKPNPGDGFFRTRGGNYLRGAIVGHGDVPVVQCLSDLKIAGYDGYVAIEFEGMEATIPALTIAIANLKRFIEQA